MDGAYFLFRAAARKRKGIDSLARLCQEKLQEDPFSGCLFVFRSRRGTSIRILTYDSCSVFSNVQSFTHVEAWRTPHGNRLHITDASEAFQPLEDRLVLTPSSLAGAWQGLHAGDGVPLHVEIDGGISMVVLGLACPSHWLMVDRSTPDFSKATAAL